MRKSGNNLCRSPYALSQKTPPRKSTMSTGERPGGLTALAVFNFIFTGFGAITLLGLAAATKLVEKSNDEAAKAAMAKVSEHLPLIMAVTVISSALLLIS